MKKEDFDFIHSVINNQNNDFTLSNAQKENFLSYYPDWEKYGEEDFLEEPMNPLSYWRTAFKIIGLHNKRDMKGLKSFIQNENFSSFTQNAVLGFLSEITDNLEDIEPLFD